MNRNLLIVGAGNYALVATEIAEDMGCFERIAYVDDKVKTLKNGGTVVGTTGDIKQLSSEYSNIVVAIGDPKVRLLLLDRIKEMEDYHIVSLISPKAYVSPSAQIMNGCIVEPMAVVSTDCVIGEGCIISAGAVVNHTSVCGDAVHVNCNATIASYARVPTGTQIGCGEIYKKHMRPL